MSLLHMLRKRPNRVMEKSMMNGDKIREILNKADKNKDGNISRAELEEAVRELHSRFPLFRSWCGLQHADANNDGQINPSEMDDLVRYLLNWYHDNK